jgi:hypothetical protein
MLPAFAHDAVLDLEAGADERAPGGTITVELCGHWEHEGPCRWPHLTTVASRAGQRVTLRVLFVAPPGEETEVRERIVRALRAGWLDGPGGTSRWTVRAEGGAVPSPDEALLVARLQGARGDCQASRT